MDVMNVQQLLMIPEGEIAFIFDSPDDSPADKLDPDRDRLRVECRGPREWQSFKEWPAALQNTMTQPTHVPIDWRPDIKQLDRFATFKINVVDLLKKSIIGRVNHALKTSSRPMRIVCTPRILESNKCIEPDLVVIDGRRSKSRHFRDNIVAFGDVRVKRPRDLPFATFLPNTTCYEGWLARPVQACVDRNIPFGFQLTNRELIIFQLVRIEDDSSSTKAICASVPEHDDHDEHTSLTPNRQRDAICPSPVPRQQQDWLHFHGGDADIPSIDAWTSLPSSPPPVRQRDQTPSGSQGSVFTQHGRPNLDPVSVLIRTYNLKDNPEAGIRLFELIMLAKELKNKGQLRIGPHKYV